MSFRSLRPNVSKEEIIHYYGLGTCQPMRCKQTKKSPTKTIFVCAAVVANLKLCCLATITDRSSVAWQPLPTQTVLTPPQKFLLNNLQLADKRAEQAHASLAVMFQHWGHTLSTFTHHCCTFHFKQSNVWKDQYYTYIYLCVVKFSDVHLIMC